MYNRENNEEETTFYFTFLSGRYCFGEVNEFKGLGIITDQHFNWNSHTDKVVVKAKMLGLMKRTCKGLDNLKTPRTLYCSLVRSNLSTARWYGLHIPRGTLKN